MASMPRDADLNFTVSDLWYRDCSCVAADRFQRKDMASGSCVNFEGNRSESKLSSRFHGITCDSFALFPQECNSTSFLPLRG